MNVRAMRWNSFPIPSGTAEEPVTKVATEMVAERAALAIAGSDTSTVVSADAVQATTTSPATALNPSGAYPDEPSVPALAPVILLPARPRPRDHFLPLSRWEGVVLAVRENEFDARLADLDGNEPQLEATFDTQELSRDDLPLLSEGAIFYWYVGYVENASRRRTRVSDLRLRRLPAEDARDVDAAMETARAIRAELGLE